MRMHKSEFHRDLIVIGSSAGGIQACCTILKGLPPDLPASLFIVQHIGKDSQLAIVLARCDSLQVRTAVDRESIIPGRVYVAPPDRHLLVRNGYIEVSKGPRENRHRPSVDALFRSAAKSARARVIAVVLTGGLDDGAAGAVAVKTRGGIVIVQDPEDATVPEMPRNTMRAVKVDYCVPLAQIPALLVRLVRKPLKSTAKQSSRKHDQARKAVGAVPFTCPDCHGPLYPVDDAGAGQLKCRIGHRFSPESLSEAHKETLERTLITALRMINERKAIHQNLAKRGQTARTELGARFQESAEAADRDAVLLQEIIDRL